MTKRVMIFVRETDSLFIAARPNYEHLCILNSSFRGLVSRSKDEFLDTADITVGNVQKLVLMCKSRPRTELFR